MTNRFIHRKAVMFSPLLLLGLILLLGAASPAISAATDLPPRPTAEPTPVPTATPVQDEPHNPGATISLYVPDGLTTMWTVVQWQDAFGGWHDVDGWRGHLDDGQGQMKIWWVAPKDFNTGPFRWQVYSSDENGRSLGNSETFNLPGGVNDIVYVQIDLAP
jgi:hypothetical protein